MGFGEIMWGLKFKVYTGAIISVCILSSCSGGDQQGHGARGSLPEQELTNYDQSVPATDIFTAQCVNAEKNTLRTYAKKSFHSIVNGHKVQSTDVERTRSVLLLIKDENNKISVCSSTLINDVTLVTAAHCIQTAKQVMAVFHTDITCENGFDRLSHGIMVNLTVPHPDYKGSAQIKSETDYNPDIALVFLEKKAPATYPRFVIAKSPENLKSSLVLFGYGKTVHGDSLNLGSAALRKTTIPQDDFNFKDGNIVIDQKNKTGICHGDSGGGAMMLNQDNKLVLTAVNSLVYSATAGVTDLCNDSSMLVVLGNYKSWIEDTIRQQTK